MLKKKIAFFIGILILMILLIPTLLVSMASAESSLSKKTNLASIKEWKEQPSTKQIQVPTQPQPTGDILLQGPTVKVYLTKEKKIVNYPLEHYVRNVVASEMPADFHIEALKAQAMAARTYIVDRLKKSHLSDMKKYGDAHVTDTVQHQAFQTDETLQRNWGSAYQEKIKNLENAVLQTSGQILTYEGKPIYAAFFSTSNGKTENSEEYFSQAYPYLKSVESPWDQQSPKFEKTVSMSIQQMATKLSQKSKKPLAFPTIASENFIITKRSTGNRVATIIIGDQKWTGREVREALGLASSDFSWEITGDRITFRTLGFGHGVGMSQWGANLMAKDGKKAEEIVMHYYQGVRIEPHGLK
ncbi:stage II sporulation protein D [Risungbinella massiliensis]|uniref:stage II sporulation protein D n=1 Tax=Risungbinella massiliensis TaxID=1329796 RepID=UPI0005CBCE14|nr:stage II sporulation protein D [Risungbinella massiliensis]